MHSKRLEYDECRPKLEHLLVEISRLRQVIKENQNHRETEKYKIISGLETQMRNKAELEAMKAAMRSQWAYNDPELKLLAQNITQLERRVH